MPTPQQPHLLGYGSVYSNTNTLSSDSNFISIMRLFFSFVVSAISPLIFFCAFQNHLGKRKERRKERKGKSKGGEKGRGRFKKRIFIANSNSNFFIECLLNMCQVCFLVTHPHTQPSRVESAAVLDNSLWAPTIELQPGESHLCLCGDSRILEN